MNFERRSFFISDMDIRMINIRPDFRKRSKELSIGKTELAILECIDAGLKTSSEIALYLKKNVNSISTQLKKLKRKGYVCRLPTNAKSGGLEYRYENIYEYNNTIQGID